MGIKKGKGSLSEFGIAANRRHRQQNCVDDGKATWFFDVNVPDLSSSDYNLDNAARSIRCEAVN